MLGRAYAVLSDPEQRAVYDEQGLVDEESDVRSQDRDWAEYWRLLFKKVGVVSPAGSSLAPLACTWVFVALAVSHRPWRDLVAARLGGASQGLSLQEQC